MVPRRRLFFYAAYLLLCAELTAKLCLLLPWVRARLPGDEELGWRARWVGRYLFERRPIFYHFDAYDPSTGWVLQPNLRGFRQFPGSTVDSNSRGIRGRAEHAPGRQPGLSRVLVVGDSFAFGEGVGDHETFAHQLELRSGPGVEVINLGVHGYGHDQMLLRLRSEGLRYAPDLVVLGFFADDADRNLLAFRDYAKPRYVLDGAALVLTGSPVPPPRRLLLREALRSHLAGLAGMAWRRARGRRGDDRGRAALMAALLDEMRQESSRAGARFVIVDLPPPNEIAGGEGAPSERLLLDYARPRGVPVCRTRAALQRRLAGGAGYAMTLHYDAALHRDVAEILARCLADGGLLPPATGRP